MSTQAAFALRGRNPDVLTCIANLSNDEVFTPPEFANQMLDTLAEAWAADHNGARLWADKAVKFLDPCTKSGVFLREITSRLTKGLEAEIPDLEERVNHILTKQVFGIGITRLTSLLARRSVYCSKHARGKHSIAKGFASDNGNIWFERTEHAWVAGKCKYCGASKNTFDRGAGLETHAYAVIHTDNIKTRVAELFGGDMQFDVIIGNPPYQLASDGGTRDIPIYHKFVDAAQWRTRDNPSADSWSDFDRRASVRSYPDLRVRACQLRGGSTIHRALRKNQIFQVSSVTPQNHSACG
jgi:site-specific DNA-methyltransferase (adenine-specific)